MKPSKREYLTGLLIILAGVLGAATILTIPALFDPQNGAPVWTTVALGCTFLALAAIAKRERRQKATGRRQ